MALDITQLRAAFAKKAEGTGEGSGNTGFWEKFYAFYKMEFDTIATVRFLPDADQENPLVFIVENKYHELWINGKKKQVACLKMYGETCPCCEKSSEYYNAGDQTMGKKFWRKIDYLAAVAVVNSPFEFPIKAGDNPVRLVSMSKQLYDKVETEIVKGDMDSMPCDMVDGYDFRIMKTKKVVPDGKGGTKEYGNYTDSSFARKASPLPDAFVSNEKFELVDIKKFRFGKIEREQMETMIEAALTGAAYTESTTAPAQTAVQKAVESPKPTQAAEAVMAAVAAPIPAPAVEGDAPKKLTPAEILAKLKARSSAN